MEANKLDLLHGVKVLSAETLDPWEGPWVSVAEAVLEVPSTVRYLGREVIINEVGQPSKRYVWKNGVTDLDLVEKDMGDISTYIGAGLNYNITTNKIDLGTGILNNTTNLDSDISDTSKIFNSTITRTNGTITTNNIFNRSTISTSSNTEIRNSYIDATRNYSSDIVSDTDIGGAGLSIQLVDNIGLTSTYIGANQDTINIGISNDSSVLYSGISLSPDNISITDELNETGLLYQNDYSVSGNLNPLWIPNWGYVKDYVDIASTSGYGTIYVSDWDTIKITGYGVSGTSGYVSYLGTLTFIDDAIGEAHVYINGLRTEVPLQSYFDTPGNSIPSIGSVLYFDLDELGYDIETDDTIMITYLINT